MTFKTIAKRIYHLPKIAVFELRRLSLCLQGAQIARGAALAPIRAPGKKRNLKVGRGTFIGRVILHLHRPIEIGCRVVINDDVTIFTASHDVESPQFKATFAPVFIEDYAWVATGACIMPGVKIGRGSVVGAHSVVTKDVPPYTVVAGNPAREVKKRSEVLDYNPVKFVAAFEAWA